MKRIFHLICSILLIQAAAFPCLAENPGPSARLNVLILFADDQRADTIGALGNLHIKTPNLDRLAKSGLAFTRSYMQGGMQGATCVPSRAMLLSGQSLFHIDEKLLRNQTWPAAFGAAGYRTFMSGKWHNGPASISKSFQQARGIFTGGMTNPLHAPLSDLQNGKLTAAKPSAKHACAVFAEEAIRLLNDPDEAPFFCYLPFDAPHDPHTAPNDFPISYDPAQMPLPKNFLPLHPFDNGEMTVRDEKLLPWPRTEQAVKSYLAEYYRYISYLDSQIGRVLDALAASRHANNTLVVFAADSGVARGSHGLIGKQNVYEHSVRVPLILSGPGIPVGKTTAAMCYLFDLLPTLGKLCGVSPPNKSEGREFTAVLRDPAAPARPHILTAYRSFQRAVRNDRWKLIRCPVADRTLLFDLQADPEETKDLSNDAAQAGPLAEMNALLRKAMEEFGDTTPLQIANPKTGPWSAPNELRR